MAGRSKLEMVHNGIETGHQILNSTDKVLKWPRKIRDILRNIVLVEVIIFALSIICCILWYFV